MALLRNVDRLARVGVIVSDLRRSPLAVAGFRMASRLLDFDASTRTDGVLSIRRGYTEGELDALMHQAGVEGRSVRRPGFRLVAAWRPGSGVAQQELA